MPMKKEKKTTAFLAIIGLLVLMGALIISLSAARKPQEMRQKAATPSGSAQIFLSPTSGTFTTKTPLVIMYSANIGSLAIDGIQIATQLTGMIPSDLSFKAATITGLTATKKIVETNAGGKLLKFVFLATPTKPYANNSLFTLGTLTMTPTKQGSVTISFDPTLTKILQNKTAQDILNIPQQQTYTFVTPTPTPTPRPTLTSTPTPH